MKRVYLFPTACILNLSIVLASWKNSLFSQGVYLLKTLLVKFGAGLSRMREEIYVLLRTTASGSLTLAIMSFQLTLDLSERKASSSKFFSCLDVM